MRARKQPRRRKQGKGGHFCSGKKDQWVPHRVERCNFCTSTQLSVYTITVSVETYDVPASELPLMPDLGLIRHRIPYGQYLRRQAARRRKEVK